MRKNSGRFDVIVTKNMFEHAFQLHEEAKLIREAVSRSLAGNFVTEDLDSRRPRSTSEVGNWIAEYIRNS